jgi:F5/8 type C domain-containing protein
VSRLDILDDFRDPSGWMPVASGLATLHLEPARGPAGAALALEFDFHGGGGFVVARKVFSRSMPESWALSFAISGAAPANQLELKLVDPSGRNVWRRCWQAFQVPAAWQTLTVRSTEVEFAWGPAGGGTLRALGALEIALAAGPGGAGTVRIAELRLTDRTYRGTPIVRASSARARHPPAHALDGDAATAWRSAATPGTHRLEVDFGEEREYGGLVVRWAEDARPRVFRVETSSDGSAWTTRHAAEAADVERSFVYLPGAVSRFLALALDAGADGAGVADLAVEPFEFSRSIRAFFEHVARSEPRGHHPRWLAGEQSYWTPVGVPDGETCAIMNEEGLVEVDRGTFSLEPSVHLDGRLVTWADAEIVQTLEDGWLPIPSSVWRARDLGLRTTAFAGRVDGRAVLFLRYRIESHGAVPCRARLFAAIRPFQVNPPWQEFGELGGPRRIADITWDGRVVVVDGSRAIVPLEPPSGFGAAAFEQGEITTHLARGVVPARPAVADAFGYGSAALAFDLVLAPGAPRDVYLVVPFGPADAAAAASLAGTRGEDVFDAAVRDWRERLGSVTLRLPPSAHDHADAMRTAAAHVLVNRDRAALQPGPRRYTRSWIRDGAIMAAALLRVGRPVDACAFVRWYATYQRADGNVPCAVDRSGPDWLAEHDSHGELIFAVMECFRFTRDRVFLAEMWPGVQRAVAYLEALRHTRLGPEFDAPALRGRRGLLPESASHEGYLAHPVHAYWDDFWALRGYGDAAAMATVLGDEREARRLRAVRDEFRTAVHASIARTIEERRIAFVPGSVEWADFDPTATANAVALLGLLDDLPRDALERTFDEYLAGFRRRRAGEIDWNNYSAYEVRILGALVRLGRRHDAAELAAFFLDDRRPRAWNQWPEISWRDPRSPGHLGDVPHAWIGAEYILSVLSMLAFERDADDALVLAAGVPASWLDEGEVGVTALPTRYGGLDLRLTRDGPGTLVASIGGTLTVPAGGIELRPPLDAPLASVTVNGRAVGSFGAEHATVHTAPAHVVLRSTDVRA